MILTSCPAVICPMSTDAADQQQRERADAVQHAIAHALLEHVPGDEADAAAVIVDLAGAGSAAWRSALPSA